MAMPTPATVATSIQAAIDAAIIAAAPNPPTGAIVWAAIVGELQTMIKAAVVSTTVSAGGLQNLPATLAPGQPTAAPSSPVSLTGTITG